jgi:outer membrane immunogenic protein
MMNRSFVVGAALTSILAGSAMAADMPTKVSTYRPEVFSWSGFYIGGHLGYGSSSNDWNILDVGSTGNKTFNLGSGTINGALGGVQVGVNWQTGPVVLGVEADFSWADMSGETCNFVLGGSFLCSSKVQRFGTITGRIGGAFDRTLFYLKAGGAWVRDTHTVGIVAGDTFEATTSKSKWGWTGGAGVEYAITHNWSAKFEYDFLLFGAERYTFDFSTAGSPTVFDADIKQRIHTVKLGFNYRFDWGRPVGARY